MSTSTELRARAAELESRVSPVTAGPRTDDERMWLEKASALRNEADRAEERKIEFPLRARHAGTDPVHAVRSTSTGGHNTACQMWLDPKAAHIWLPEDSQITCGKCSNHATEK